METGMIFLITSLCHHGVNVGDVERCQLPQKMFAVGFTTAAMFNMNMLNTEVLSIAIVGRCDDFANSPEYTPTSYRKAAYRQWVMWQHGYLGRHNRKVLPSCVVWAVHNVYPSPDGVYLGFKEY